MHSRLLWRRSATAAGLYASVAFGILGTIVAANVLGLAAFGVFATAMATASFFQTLLDLTVEESLTKYGFRYVTQEEWGRLRRLFRRALELKLGGGLAAGFVLLALAPVADGIFGTTGLRAPFLAAALLPVVQAPENVGATALLLRGRYDLRGAYQAFAMALRFSAIAIGVHLGVWEAIALVVLAQALATLVVSIAGEAALGRFPRAPQVSIGADRREIVSFVLGSSLATAVVSLRTTLAPILLGLASGTSAVGLFRVAQAPQTGLTAATGPVRLVLLTEQTRDWERGRRNVVMAGVRRYSLTAAVVMAVAVPVCFVAMPWLVRTVFRDAEYGAAVDAARIVLFAGAIHVILGWTKSLPTTIGKPRMRVITHGIEALVLLPLVVVLGAHWGVTGAAVAVLLSAVAFALAWAVALTRIQSDVAAVTAATRAESAPAS
jgi:O-antigen/teichoic acid export membrane protein